MSARWNCWMRRMRAGGIMRPGHERGFMLIGVVMFTLVLSILALSLFSLSGFEVGFLGHSLNRAQAFYDASGGIERAKFVLMRTDSLQMVSQWVVGQGVVSAGARQGTDWESGTSVGAVDWGGDDVWIQVLAERGGQQRLLEARFDPALGRGIWENVLTAYGGIQVISSGDAACFPSSPDNARHLRAFIYGNVWQNSPNTAWVSLPTSGTHTVIADGQVPDLDLSDYMNQHTWVDLPPLVGVGPFTLPPAPGASPVFLRTYDRVGLGQTSAVKLTITGTVVWMLNDGVTFFGRLHLFGTTNSRLIIVARDPSVLQAGVVMEQGFEFGDNTVSSPEFPVFICSDKDVRISHVEGGGCADGPFGTGVGLTSIYGRNIILQAQMDAPNAPSKRMVLRRNPVPPGQPDPIVDPLLPILPRPDFTNKKLTFQRGTWRELNPSGSS
jgi:hypothetical protein